jgi:hypothetical protein
LEQPQYKEVEVVVLEWLSMQRPVSTATAFLKLVPKWTSNDTSVE